MSAPDEPTSNRGARAALHDLAEDLRNWLDWAQLTGADAAPADPNRALVTEPPPVARPRAPAPARPAPPPRIPADRTATAPAPRTPIPPPPPTTSSPAPAPAPITRAPIPPPARAPQPIATVLREAGLETLQQVQTDLGDCRRCRLHEGRKHIVFGIGRPDAKLVLVGEAPGQQEDLTGEPFVGRSGQLLNRMLQCIGLARTDVYICNVIKCRPPQNRDPLGDEIATCSPFLQRQLAAIGPRVIMTLGRFAATNVVGQDATLGELRQNTWAWQGIPVVASYHPSYLLRTPKMKRAAWDDFLAVRALLRGASDHS